MGSCTVRTMAVISMLLLIALASTASAQQAVEEEDFFVAGRIYKATADFAKIYSAQNTKIMFMVTDQALEKIEKDAVTRQYRQQLENIKDQPYDTQVDFEAALKQVLLLAELDEGARRIVQLSIYRPVLKRKTKIYIVEIVGDRDDKHYLFSPLDGRSEKSGVRKDAIYAMRASDHPQRYLRTWHYISHGTLVVPFKVRSDDWSLAGDSTIGYYFGYTVTVPHFNVDVTPLASFGLTILSFPVAEGETEGKTAISGAGGLLFTIEKNFQIGIVAGLDHLGGDDGGNWQHEDDLWLSFMVGYNFAR